jgi:predicted PurR-regulated permease PerM
MKHDGVLRISLLLIASIITLAALYYSQAIMAPVTFALFTVAIAWPLQSALQKRIPVLLALVVTMVVALAVLAILIFLVVWGFGLVFQWVSTAFKHFMRKQRNGLIATAYQSPILWPTATIPDGSLARSGRLAAGATVSYLSSLLPLPSLCSDCWKSISRDGMSST